MEGFVLSWHYISGDILALGHGQRTYLGMVLEGVLSPVPSFLSPCFNFNHLSLSGIIKKDKNEVFFFPEKPRLVLMPIIRLLDLFLQISINCEVFKTSIQNVNFTEFLKVG